MPTSGIRLFRVLGITVYLHWSWLLIAVYEIQSRKGKYQSLGWNIAEYLALFAIVLMHEFGHALACRSVGGQADRIVLWPLGGVAYVRPPMRPGAMLWSIVAGPLVNVALLPVTLPFLLNSGTSDAAIFLQSVAGINLILLIFNLLPIYPLDGGKILWSLLWFIIGAGRALMISSVIGIIGAAGLALFALWSQNTWLVILALFAAFQAWMGFKNARLLRLRETVQPRPGFACPNCKTPPPIGPFWVCSNCKSRYDTFDRATICPACGTSHQTTTCAACGARAPFSQWALLPMPPTAQYPAPSPYN